MLCGLPWSPLFLLFWLVTSKIWIPIAHWYYWSGFVIVSLKFLFLVFFIFVFLIFAHFICFHFSCYGINFGLLWYFWSQLLHNLFAYCINAIYSIYHNIYTKLQISVMEYSSTVLVLKYNSSIIFWVLVLGTPGTRLVLVLEGQCTQYGTRSKKEPSTRVHLVFAKSNKQKEFLIVHCSQ